MNVASFLAELADKLDRGPADVAEYKTWARDCRDYATVSNLTDHLAIPKPTPGVPAPTPKSKPATVKRVAPRAKQPSNASPLGQTVSNWRLRKQ